MGSLLLVCPVCNYSLAGIHRQRWLCALWELWVLGKRLWNPSGVQGQRGCFEKADSAQVVDPLILVLAMDPEVALYPCELSTSLIGLGSATSTMHQRTWEEPCPPITHITSPDLVSVMYPEGVCDSVAAPHSYILGDSGGETVELELTIRSEMAL